MTARLGCEQLRLSADHIAEYAAVLDAAAPDGDLAAPPGPVPLGYLSAVTPFDQPLLADLHVELGMPYATTALDSVSTARDLRVGERVDADLAYEGVVKRDRRSGGRVAFATFCRTFTDDVGDEVASVRWVCALMDQPAAADVGGAASDVPAPCTPPLTVSLAQRWADCTGDHEPIHLDTPTAQAAGLPGPVAHASLITAQAERLVRSVVGGAALAGIELRHRGGVFFGDSLGVTRIEGEGFELRSHRGVVASVKVGFR